MSLNIMGELPAFYGKNLGLSTNFEVRHLVHLKFRAWENIYNAQSHSGLVFSIILPDFTSGAICLLLG